MMSNPDKSIPLPNTIAALRTFATTHGIILPAPTARTSRNELREAIEAELNRRQVARYLNEAKTGENVNLFA